MLVCLNNLICFYNYKVNLGYDILIYGLKLVCFLFIYCMVYISFKMVIFLMLVFILVMFFNLGEILDELDLLIFFDCIK